MNARKRALLIRRICNRYGVSRRKAMFWVAEMELRA